MVRTLALVTVLLAVACGDDAPSTSPDAGGDPGPDAGFVPAGDFSCIGEAPPTTAPDPLTINGAAISLELAPVAAVAVEVWTADGETMLGEDLTEGVVGDFGTYSISAATGGVAPRTYRFLSKDGFVDSYEYNDRPFDTTAAGRLNTLLLTAEQIDAFYAAAGLTRDPAKGTLWVDFYDCSRSPDAEFFVEGATVTSPSGTVVYVDETLAADPSLTASGPGGSAVVLNVEPGELATEVRAGPYTYLDASVTVRADVFTAVSRRP